MPVWVEPVFDRVQLDIEQQTSKGKLSYADLNRIEYNMEYLLDMLGVDYEPKDWTERPIPREEDMLHILEGLQKIKDGVSTLALPSVPLTPLNHFEKINRIEEIQFTAYRYLLTAELPFIRSGEAYAGETIGVI